MPTGAWMSAAGPTSISPFNGLRLLLPFSIENCGSGGVYLRGFRAADANLTIEGSTFRRSYIGMYVAHESVTDATPGSAKPKLILA